MLSHFNEFALFILAIAVFFLAMELGFRLGDRHRNRYPSDDTAKTHISGLQSALVGLLALLLGFNFAMASSRFDARKALIQDEVNAIGTAWRRVQLLPPETRGPELAALLRSYVGARIEYLRAGTDEALIDAAFADASRIEAELAQQLRIVEIQSPPVASAGQLLQSLNDMNNLKWKRRDALDNHVPEFVLHVLFAVATGAMGLIAYGYGLSGRRRHVSTGLFAVLIALVLATILDFDRPRGGFIQVKEDTLLRLQKSLEGATP